MPPFTEDIELLDFIPGVGKRTAEQILAKLVQICHDSLHLATYVRGAGMTLGHDESEGKKVHQDA